MLKIHQAIQSGRFPNATTLARELEVSTKSIHRDLEFMRDRMQLPLEYDGVRYGYHYTQEVSAFPTLQITEGELVALLVAEKALQQYRGTTFEKPLLSAFQKMAASLPDSISLSLAGWDQTIAFRTSAEPIMDLEIFDALAQAAAQRRQLRIQYRKPRSRQPETRLVDPYQLANVNGEWFLFAFDHLRRGLRTFSAARVLGAERTGQSFPRPAGFSLDQALSGSFGVHSGRGEYHVRLRFSAAVADYIREKRWHPSQRLHELAGGAVELELHLSGLEEVQRWVLGWGGEVTVLAPAEFQAAVQRAAAAIMERYPKLTRPRKRAAD
jgi:proteasome accessory factor B